MGCAAGGQWQRKNRAVPPLPVDGHEPVLIPKGIDGLLTTRPEHVELRPAAAGPIARVAGRAEASVAFSAADCVFTNGRRCGNAYDELLRDTNAQDIVAKRGRLFVWTTEAGWQKDQCGLRIRRQRGIQFDELTGDQAPEMEPALGPIVRRGIYAPNAGHIVNPHRLVTTLADPLREKAPTSGEKPCATSNSPPPTALPSSPINAAIGQSKSCLPPAHGPVISRSGSAPGEIPPAARQISTSSRTARTAFESSGRRRAGLPWRSLRRGDPNRCEISVKRRYLRGSDDGADVAVRPDQHPLAGRQAISVLEVTAIIYQIAARTDNADA